MYTTLPVNLVTEYKGKEVHLKVLVIYMPSVNYRYEPDNPADCYILSAKDIKDNKPFMDLKWLEDNCLLALEDKATAIMHEDRD